MAGARMAKEMAAHRNLRATCRDHGWKITNRVLVRAPKDSKSNSADAAVSARVTARLSPGPWYTSSCRTPNRVLDA